MHFADLIDTASVVEHALGGSGLTGINMGNDTDIACFL
jgi:hypothetical protein